MNKENLIWLAGFFDGDGCIFINKPKSKGRNPHHYLSFSISQRGRKILEYIQSLIKRGSIRPTGKGTFTLDVSSNQANDLLKQLLPYLKVKKLEALLGIQFQDIKTDCRGGGKEISKKELAWRDMHYWLLRYIKTIR